MIMHIFNFIKLAKAKSYSYRESRPSYHSWDQVDDARRDRETMIRRRQDHDAAFRERMGVQPARGWIQKEVWNGGSNRGPRVGIPAPDGKSAPFGQTWSEAKNKFVTPLINGMPPEAAIREVRDRVEQNARIDSERGVWAKFKLRGYTQDAAPRTDSKGTRIMARVTDADRLSWQKDLLDQLAMQERGRSLIADGNTEEFDKLQAEYNKRFGNLTQEEMQVRGSVIPGYVEANRKLYSRFQNPPSAPAVAPSPPPAK